VRACSGREAGGSVMGSERGFSFTNGGVDAGAQVLLRPSLPAPYQGDSLA
jgi:hypothetical protein